MSCRRVAGILFNSVANCVSVEMPYTPATYDLSLSKILALFLFVGVFTVVVCFLGAITLGNTNC